MVFIGDDGSVNEVDLLVLTPKGFFFIEIKSWPGEISGDAGTWSWRNPEGRVKVVDNPLLLANRKVKKLKGDVVRSTEAYSRECGFKGTFMGSLLKKIGAAAGMKAGHSPPKNSGRPSVW